MFRDNAEVSLPARSLSTDPGRVCSIRTTWPSSRSRLLEPGGADPAGLGDVDRHAVGATVLHLDVGIPMASVADPEGLVDVLAGLGAGVLQPLGDLGQVFDLKPDVMDAVPVLAALDSGHGVVLEVENRQVDVAVAQVTAPGARAVDLGDLLHAEHVDVELGGPVHVLGREGDVLDLRHGCSPPAAIRPRSPAWGAGYAGGRRKARAGGFSNPPQTCHSDWDGPSCLRSVRDASAWRSAEADPLARPGVWE